MPFWLTVLVGLTGAIVGGAIASAIYGTSHTIDGSSHGFVTLLLEVGAASQSSQATGASCNGGRCRGRMRTAFPRAGSESSDASASSPARSRSAS
jgi:hypothetical protein